MVRQSLREWWGYISFLYLMWEMAWLPPYWPFWGAHWPPWVVYLLPWGIVAPLSQFLTKFPHSGQK